MRFLALLLFGALSAYAGQGMAPLSAGKTYSGGGTSPVAVVQSASNSLGGTGVFGVTSAATGSNVTAANLLVYVVFYNAAGAVTTTVTGTQFTSAVQAGSCFDAGGGYGMAWGYQANTTGGTTTTGIATFSGATDFPAILIKEFSGASTSAPFTTGESVGCATQNAPGAGTNILTSGNTPALSAAPAYVFGLSFSLNGAEIPTAGTGYTSINTVWNFSNNGDSGGSLTGRTFFKSTPTTSAVAATASLATGSDNYATWVMVLH